MRARVDALAELRIRELELGLGERGVAHRPGCAAGTMSAFAIRTVAAGPPLLSGSAVCMTRSSGRQAGEKHEHEFDRHAHGEPGAAHVRASAVTTRCVATRCCAWRADDSRSSDRPAGCLDCRRRPDDERSGAAVALNFAVTLRAAVADDVSAGQVAALAGTAHRG